MSQKQPFIPKGRRPWSFWIPVIWIAGSPACSNKLSMSDCQKDAECENAYAIVLAASHTAATACPSNPKETNPTCESAMATLDQAETTFFPRLKDEDVVVVATSLMATR
jgi:hypothetical protein